jgi:arylsulfatase A
MIPINITTLVAVATAVFTAPFASASRPVGEKPNIVLIMADDVSWEAFGCYGAEDYKTPNIDRLAAGGIRFTHCYSTPICTPSRVKLMTGQYNFRNYTHFGYLNPKDKTFGHMLKEAGYKTAIAGKWQLNGLYNKLPGQDDPTRPQKAGFDESLLWQVTTGKNIKKGGGERFWSPPLEKNGEFISVEKNQGKYGPDLMCDFLCDFIERNKETPFFAYYPMILVHDPFVPTPDTIGAAPRTQVANKAQKGNAVDQKKNFVAMVEYTDKLVGRLEKKIKDLGLAENTIILFTADNGTHTQITSHWNGQDITGGKGGMTDMGTHVPFIASWPGTAPKGVVYKDLIDFTDFYTTFAEVAGIKMGDSDPIDGRSFMPRLRGKPGKPRDWMLCHYQPYWGKTPGQFARTGQFKLYRDGRFYKVPGDLKEEKNLGNTDVGKDVQQRLQAFLKQCPPAPAGKGNSKTKERPTYPKWPNLLD